MSILHRVLYGLTILLFFLTLSLTLMPSNLLMLKKPDLKIILLDVSLSNQGVSLVDFAAAKPILEKLSKDQKVLRGLFAESIVYIDKVPFVVAEKETDFFADFEKAKINIQDQLNLEATNFQNVISSILRDYSEEFNCDILLITDGRQNQGDVISIKNKLEDMNARVQFFSTNFENKDIAIEDLDLPKVLSSANEVLGTLSFKSNFKQNEALIKIKVNGKIVKTVEWNIEKGVQKISLLIPIPNEIHNRVEVEVICDDILKKNNKVIRYIKRIASEKVLLISNRKLELPDDLIKTFEQVEPLKAFSILPNLNQYECIWLDDISWLDLVEKEKIEHLESYISKGGKLFVSGGPHSFAFGDYSGSLLEKLLPVQTNPNGLLSLMVCIDASGSMEQQVHGKRKIDISVSALLELINGLQSMDEVGLIFCQNSKKPTEFISLMSKDKFELALREKYNSIPLPAGGTFLKPGMQASFEALVKNNKELRVVIFITDGESQEKDYLEIFKQYKMEKPEIVLLVIGAGLNENSLLIQNGKNIFGNNWNPIRVEEKGWFNLKESFKEAFQKISSGFSAEGQFSTKLLNTSSDFRFLNVQEGEFDGVYLKSSRKKTAISLVEIDGDNPLLALWNYGQGKVLSLQTGLLSDWSQSYFSGKQGQEVLNSIFNWMSKNTLGSKDFSCEYQKGFLLFNFRAEDVDLQNETVLLLMIHNHEFLLHRVDSHLWQTSFSYGSIPKEWYTLNSMKYQIFKQISAENVEIYNGEIPPILPSEYLSAENPELLWSVINVQGANLKMFEGWGKDGFEGAKKPEDLTNYLAFISFLFFLLMLLVRGRMF